MTPREIHNDRMTASRPTVVVDMTDPVIIGDATLYPEEWKI